VTGVALLCAVQAARNFIVNSKTLEPALKRQTPELAADLYGFVTMAMTQVLAETFVMPPKRLKKVSRTVGTSKNAVDWMIKPSLHHVASKLDPRLTAAFEGKRTRHQPVSRAEARPCRTLCCAVLCRVVRGL
jgi:hypothetical protein